MDCLLKILVLRLVTVALASGQGLPNSFFMLGASWEQKAPQASGWMSYAIKLTNNNTYSYTTEEVRAKSTALRTGLAQVLMATGPLTVLALGDGGVQTSVQSSPTKSLSYGGVAVLNLAKVFKRDIGLQLVFVMRPSTTGSGRVYQVALGKAF